MVGGVKGVGGGDWVPRHGSTHLGHGHRVQVGLLLAAAQHFPEEERTSTVRILYSKSAANINITFMNKTHSPLYTTVTGSKS
jgi:hypothetical protein